jgi:Phasin protein
MSATKASGESPRGTATQADPAHNNLEQAMTVPKKLIESQLQTSSALLNFASQRMQAQAEFLGRFSHCGSLDEAAKMQTKFFEAMLADYSHEMSHLAELARANTILATDAMRESTKIEKPN